MEELWTTLPLIISACQQCGLCKARTQTVFGSGSRSATYMFVGEAPGASEDEQGVPFVGASGKVLRGLLGRLNIPEEEVFITNVLKCRPPNNRDPVEEEIEACAPYLYSQVLAINPRVVITVGGFASRLLSGQKGKSMGAMVAGLWRCRIEGQSFPMVAMYHPSYFLRALDDRERARGILLSMRASIERAKEIADEGTLNVLG